MMEPWINNNFGDKKKSVGNSSFSVNLLLLVKKNNRTGKKYGLIKLSEPLIQESTVCTNKGTNVISSWTLMFLARSQITTTRAVLLQEFKQQKSPNQETGLGNRRRLKVLNDTKLVLNEHELPP